jgi:histidinol-phosphatase (PHP family)
MIYENFHTHLVYCGHATGHAADYRASAEKAGLAALGFSEHTPFPAYVRGGSRLALAEMPLYINEVEREKERHILPVYCGLEMDINPDLLNFYDELIIKYRLSYQIGSVHTFNFEHEWYDVTFINNNKAVAFYIETIIRAIESRRFTFIGHPDRLCFHSFVVRHIKNHYDSWRVMLQTANKNNVFIELNTSHFNYNLYDTEAVRHLWRIAAEENVAVIINSDAHKPQDIVRNFDIAYTFAQEIGLNVIRLSERLR